MDWYTPFIWMANGLLASLFENSVFVNPVISPAVPEGSQLLRTSYMATHAEEQVARVLTVLEQVGQQLGFIPAA